MFSPEETRRQMIHGQLMPNRITDPVLLEAFASVGRECFVPQPWQQVAYADEDIPLRPDRCLPEPVLCARLINEAGLKAGHHVLVIGAYPGYTAALAGRLGCRVTALEADDELAEAVRTALHKASAEQVTVETGALIDGWQAGAPYDAILIDGAVTQLPEILYSQLAEGGVLVTVERCSRGSGQLVRYTRHGDTPPRKEVICDAATPVLPDFQTGQTFTFQ